MPMIARPTAGGCFGWFAHTNGRKMQLHAKPIAMTNAGSRGAGEGTCVVRCPGSSGSMDSVFSNPASARSQAGDARDADGVRHSYIDSVARE
eukprot:COSAG02_NODE_59129_length_275_cov_0.590909_1_plen_91_part_11